MANYDFKKDLNSFLSKYNDDEIMQNIIKEKDNEIDKLKSESEVQEFLISKVNPEWKFHNFFKKYLVIYVCKIVKTTIKLLKVNFVFCKFYISKVDVNKP